MFQGAEEKSCGIYEENVRERGKNLVLMSHDLVALERMKIFLIIAKLKTHMMYSVLVFTVMGGFGFSDKQKNCKSAQDD